MTEMEKELIRALAKIDDALGMPQDGCNDLDSTITAIELLHAIIKDNDKIIKSSEKRIAELEEKLRVAREANTALVNFARDVIFFNGDYAFDNIDGLDIQFLARKHGLVKETTMTEPCGENCACAEYAYSFPTQCNRATELIALKTIEG